MDRTLNRAQKRQLQAYLHFRGRAMSVAGLIRFNWRIFALLTAAGGITVGGLLVLHATHYALLLAVAYITLLYRDLAYCFKWSRTWPLVSEVLDWSKVEQAAASGHLPPNNSSKPTPLRGAA